MTDNQRRALVIGAGSIGVRHLRLIREMGYPVMACDVDRAALEAARGEVGDMETFTDLRSALASGPEFAVVATAHRLHREHTIAALEAGAHVLCEKPIADTLEAADAMIAAARRTNRVLHIGFMNRYHPCIVRARELVRSGELGLPLFASADLGSYRTLVCSRSRHQAHVHGALFLDYTHQLDFVPYVLGSPASRVYAVSRNRGSFELQSDPNCAAIILEHEAGPVSEIHLDYCREPQVTTLSVTGDRASVQCDLMTYALKVGYRADGRVVEERFDVQRDDLYRVSFRNFVEAVDGREAEIVTGDSGRQSLQVVEAVLASLKTGQPECLT